MMFKHLLGNLSNHYIISTKVQTNPSIKMMSQAQAEAFEKDVKRFHDRPIEFIPRTELGTTYGGVDLTDRLKSDNDVSCGGHRAATCAGCPQGHGSSKTFFVILLHFKILNA